MNLLPIRRLDRLILSEFIPFFLIGVGAFTLLMVAVTLFKQILDYLTAYGLSGTEVGYFLILALPQTVAYTFPMAVLFAGLLSFGRLSDTSQITALRAGGIGFFRIVLPALLFAWLVVLATFVLNEKVAPRSSMEASLYIKHALIERGITQQATDISYMDQEGGWLFAAATGQGNVFHDVKWWDFSRPGETVLYTADEGIWQEDRWEFHNAHVLHISAENTQAQQGGGPPGGETGIGGGGNVTHSLTSENLEMYIARTPSDILAAAKRDPEEMSLQELEAYLRSPEAATRTEEYRRKILATYHLKISAPFASIVFILLAAPLSLTPQRSSSTMGVGLSMLLVFFYYMMLTFAVKVAQNGAVPPAIAAWIPNVLFLLAGIYLNARFYMRSA
jgi:lipopolysaccharide export system permease protein